MASEDALGCSVPDFARGLRILLIDRDSSSLSYMASFLELCSFKVTTTDLMSVALSILQQHKKTFKIVMANFNVPDEADVSLLHKLAECDLPIIFFTSNPHKYAVARALEAGANFLMDLPVSEQNLKYIWQHALRSKSGLLKNRDDGGYFRRSPKRKHEYAQNRQDYSNTFHGKQAEGDIRVDDDDDDDDGLERKAKRLKISSTIVYEQVGDDSNIPVEADHTANQIKKSRFVWNSKLQHKFTSALSALRDADIRPKAIWQMMDVPNLTLRQVASHLQKYKFQVQRMRDIMTADLQPCKEPCCSRFVRVDSLQNLEKHDLPALNLEVDRNKGLSHHHKELGPVTSKNGKQCVDQTPTPQSTTTNTSGHTTTSASIRVHPKEDYFHDLSGVLCAEPFLSSSSRLSPPNNGPGGDDWEMDLDYLLDFEKSL